MKAFAGGLLAMTLAVSAYGETHAPLRSTKSDRVIGMIAVANWEDGLHVRATTPRLIRRRAATAWIFCRDGGGRVGPPLRLDGNIGSPTLEGAVDLLELCGDEHLVAATDVEIVLIDHGKPVNGLLHGVEGSTIQVTTNQQHRPVLHRRSKAVSALQGASNGDRSASLIVARRRMTWASQPRPTSAACR